MICFEVTGAGGNGRGPEFATESIAKLYAEQQVGPGADIIGWNRSPNLPGAYPLWRYFSFSLQRLQADGTWKRINIF